MIDGDTRTVNPGDVKCASAAVLPCTRVNAVGCFSVLQWHCAPANVSVFWLLLINILNNRITAQWELFLSSPPVPLKTEALSP